MSGMMGGRVSNHPLLRCVVEWKEVSSRLMWVRVKIEGVGCLYQHIHQLVRGLRRRYMSSGVSHKFW